jgi:hypothetical protein
VTSYEQKQLQMLKNVQQEKTFNHLSGAVFMQKLQEDEMGFQQS